MSKALPVIIDLDNPLHLCPCCNGEPTQEHINELSEEVEVTECHLCDGWGLVDQRKLDAWEEIEQTLDDAQLDQIIYHHAIKGSQSNDLW